MKQIKVMEKNYTKKNDLERAGGAEVEPEGEVETGVAEIIQLFKESDLRQAEEKEKKKDGVEKELADAEEFRKQSLETVGETKKRKQEESGKKEGGKRRRSDDTF